MPEATKRKQFPLRPRTGTASYHLSSAAVDFGMEDIAKMTQREALAFFAQARWGSSTEMPCPHCGTFAKHYWSITQLRWKCTCCGKRFSVTSGTVFAGRKLPLTKILGILLTWSNGASGKAARHLRRDWHVSYATAFTLIHKVREALTRGYNTGVLCGVAEMDGTDVTGWNYRDKRGRPQGWNRGKPKVPEHLKKKDPNLAEPNAHVKQDKRVSQPADRRIGLVVRARHVGGIGQGRGGCQTRVAVALTESSDNVKRLATRFVSSESIIMSDEDPSYNCFKQLFAAHKSVAHSRQYALPDGTNNNQAESLNRRIKRAIRGVYMTPSLKYMKEYLVEQAWREDTRRLSTGERLRHMLQFATNVGTSLWWPGYTHGRHREHELLVEGPRPVPPRGRPKGAEPRPPC